MCLGVALLRYRVRALSGSTRDVALTSKVLRCAFPCCAALQPEAFAAPLAAAANKETFGFVAPVSLGQWKLMPGARQSPQTRMGHAEYRAPDSVKTPQLSSYPSSWALFGYGTVPWPYGTAQKAGQYYCAVVYTRRRPGDGKLPLLSPRLPAALVPGLACCRLRPVRATALLVLVVVGRRCVRMISF